MRKNIKAFTLIELLVVVAILSILSSLGVVGYNKYTTYAKNAAVKNNFESSQKAMNNEFAKCDLNKNAKIFNNHDCNNNSAPSTSLISGYLNNQLKNPYDQNTNAASTNPCIKGSVSITNENTGTYKVGYAEENNLSSTFVNSSWSTTKKNTTTISSEINCSNNQSNTSTASSKPQGSFDTYKPPYDGPGAGIIVDKNGNMVPGQGAHACSADCFKTDGPMKNWYTMINGQRVYPARSGGEYRFVMVEGASSSGNIASSCSGGNCKYNFADNTYTVINSGKIYNAGDSIDNRQPIN